MLINLDTANQKILFFFFCKKERTINLIPCNQFVYGDDAIGYPIVGAMDVSSISTLPFPHSARLSRALNFWDPKLVSD